MPDKAPYLPLAGVRILDMSSVLMGPFATHFLADHGADVIKIEPPEGEILRHHGPRPVPTMGAMFQHVNRGKQSLTLDLKKPAAREVLLRLTESADAVVTNVRPQAMARLGLGYDVFRQAKPSIVYCSLVGYGEGGSYAGRPAMDDLIQGATGMADLMGRKTSGPPRYLPMAMVDRLVGLYGAIALATALLGRERTGQGCEIEVPMFEATAHFVLVEQMYAKSFEPALGAPISPRSIDANHKPFQTRDGHVCLLPYTDGQWFNLFRAIGRPELEQDARFCSFSARTVNAPAMFELLAQVAAERSTAECLRIAAECDIPSAPMHSIESLIEDPHLGEVSFFDLQAVQGQPAFRAMRSPMKFNAQALPTGTAPALGAHTDALLAQAGYTPDAIERLHREGVLGANPTTPRSATA